MNMDHIFELNEKSIETLRNHLFPLIAQGEAILFLGAGASQSERRYLCADIIRLYSDKIGANLGTDDLVEFVDMISSNPEYDRNDFDEFIVSMLSKLQPTETHKIIARLNWKEIITTNCDLVIERAFDQLAGTSAENLKMKAIRRVSEYFYRPSNDEVKYVKLNGCVSDRSDYPLIFSSRDFDTANGFYRTVLSTIENLSPKCALLTIGYSFSDPFAKKFLTRFDKFNRNRRWMISVDPFVEKAQLPFFSEKKICIIRLSAAEFFDQYAAWERETVDDLTRRTNLIFADREKNRLTVPHYVLKRIGQGIVQLWDDGRYPFISPEDFYRGEVPTYDVVKKNIDVVKVSVVTKTVEKVRNILGEPHELVPILILAGGYGIGKSTLAYRIVHELTSDPTFDALAFEVGDHERLGAADLGELFAASKARNIILLFNGIEVDSVFKSLMGLRMRLSMEQFHSFNLLILASIRENILQKFTTTDVYNEFTIVDVGSGFTTSEASDLVQKLGDAGIMKYRDARERNSIASKVVSDYKGDTFISLISLVSNSNHSHFLQSAYNQLSKKAQQAFLYVSLLYRYGILTPAALLQRILSITWDEFRTEILEYDSKGILIQEEHKTQGTDPDLYIRTKHPIVSNELVKLILPNEDAQFLRYQTLLRKLSYGSTGAKLAVDLLKAIRLDSHLSDAKLNALYDLCGEQLADDPHFALHYAINLQHRHDVSSLKRAIDIIMNAESLLPYRSDHLIHRRAVLYFELAKATYDTEKELSETREYIRNAMDLFEIKRLLDPFSHFSYVDYIKLGIWCLDKVLLLAEQRVHEMVRIENLIEEGKENILENQQLLAEVEANYLRTKYGESTEKYRDFVSSLLNKEELKPYGLILQYYQYERDKNLTALLQIVKELEGYFYLDYVAKALLKYYGNNLYLLEARQKMFDLIRGNRNLEQMEPVRTHFYSYIAEAYNRNFGYIWEHIDALRKKFHTLNLGARETWRDGETGEPALFDAIITRSDERGIHVKVSDLQRSFRTIPVPSHIFDLSIGSRHHVNLHFFLAGMKAELLD
jgi:hypothetical protein